MEKCVFLLLSENSIGQYYMLLAIKQIYADNYPRQHVIRQMYLTNLHGQIGSDITTETRVERGDVSPEREFLETNSITNHTAKNIIDSCSE